MCYGTARTIACVEKYSLYFVGYSFYLVQYGACYRGTMATPWHVRALRRLLPLQQRDTTVVGQAVLQDAAGGHGEGVRERGERERWGVESVHDSAECLGVVDGGSWYTCLDMCCGLSVDGALLQYAGLF